MKVWKGWRYDKATPEEKLLTLAGVPEPFWGKGMPPHFRPIPFEDFTGKAQKINARVQEGWARKLAQEQELIQGYLIVIGSVGPDRQSLQLAFDWVRDFLIERNRVLAKVINLADVPHRREQDLEGMPVGANFWRACSESQVLLMHNILGKECTADRVQTTRDLITRFHHTTRILVVAGANPVSFCQEVLCVKPDVALYTDGQVRRTVSH